MQIFFSMSMGLIIAVLALWLVRREVMKASFFKHVNIKGFNENASNDLIEHIQKLETTIDEMNQSFYDIVSDLEGKYSVHDKEIELLENQLRELSNVSKELNMLLNVQGKEIASFKPIDAEKVTEQPESNRLLSKRKEQDYLKNEIIRLKALGMDEQQIARQLGKGVREIKMLMNFIK